MKLSYLAITGAGLPVSGVLEEPSEEQAHARLSRCFARIERLRPARFTLPARLSVQSLTLFLRQLTFLIQSGIPIHRALEFCMHGGEPALNHYLWQVADRVRGGAPLSDAMREHPDAFPAFMASVVEVGEGTGRLVHCLQRLAESMFGAYTVRRKLIADLTYPLLLAVFSLLMLATVSLFTVPRLEELFLSLKVELPNLTQWVLATFPLAALGLAAWFALRSQPELRRRLNHWLVLRGSRMGVVGPTLEDWWASRLIDNLVTVLEAGVPLLSGMDLLIRNASNDVVRERLAKVRESLMQGDSLSAALGRHQAVPRLAWTTIAVGEASGDMTGLMRRLVSYYDRQLEYRAELLTSLAGTVVLTLMGVVIGVLSAAMLMPILYLVSIL